MGRGVLLLPARPGCSFVHCEESTLICAQRAEHAIRAGLAGTGLAGRNGGSVPCPRQGSHCPPGRHSSRAPCVSFNGNACNIQIPSHVNVTWGNPPLAPGSAPAARQSFPESYPGRGARRVGVVRRASTASAPGSSSLQAPWSDMHCGRVGNSRDLGRSGGHGTRETSRGRHTVPVVGI